MKKRKLLILIAVVALCATWIYSCHKDLTKDVATPEIKKGEFPFKLVYQIGDEVFTVEDTYVCKYKGERWNWNQGGYREWKGYIKGTGKEWVELTKDGEYSISVFVGSAEYFMGLISDGFGEGDDTPSPVKIDKTGGMYSIWTAEDIQRYKHIKVLSLEHADQIQNSLIKDGVVVWRTGDSLIPPVDIDMNT